ncbi:hypothetical protein EVAR_3026_1 [Eumeta japonica]|uniref:Uncharacterized protein n=1 Tax=Eumeta variegata TaxID=151549 RepID=A0A4C1SUB6_EUMVA|nr:hypothetical protein EVAR_3026_1 [Eumeta japonica]
MKGQGKGRPRISIADQMQNFKHHTAGPCLGNSREFNNKKRLDISSRLFKPTAKRTVFTIVQNAYICRSLLASCDELAISAAGARPPAPRYPPSSAIVVVRTFERRALIDTPI